MTSLKLSGLTCVIALCGGACGGSSEGDLLVSAAASLTDAFVEIAEQFEASKPGIAVRLNLAGSSTLHAQILEGAPVDVFASASSLVMHSIAEAGEVAGAPRVFARNRLAIAVPPDNSANVASLFDLSREALLVGLCAAEVPCGMFARQALTRAGVTPSLDTVEPSVRALLTKVELGELDAAVTYVTDVFAADGAVVGIDIPEGQNVEAVYPIAVLARARQPDVARAFVDFVLSPDGQAILARHGFAAP